MTEDNGDWFARELYELIETAQDRDMNYVLMYAHLTVAAQAIRKTFDDETAEKADKQILDIIRNG